MNRLRAALLQWQRQRALKRCAFTPLIHWLHAWPEELNCLALQAPLLAVDFETTGLNPKQDAILSIGWVPVTHGRIQVGQGQHCIIRIEQPLPEETIKVHGITHQRMAQGLALEHVLKELFTAMSGRFPLVHFARIERTFLQAAFQNLGSCKPPFPMVDTFHIAQTRMHHLPHVAPQQLRLYTLREQYHLPRYPAHHALNDAIATAELFLAQMKESPNTRLSEILI